MVYNTHPHGKVEYLVRFITLNILLDLHLGERDPIEVEECEEDGAGAQVYVEVQQYVTVI